MLILVALFVAGIIVAAVRGFSGRMPHWAITTLIVLGALVVGVLAEGYRILSDREAKVLQAVVADPILGALKDAEPEAFKKVEEAAYTAARAPGDTQKETFGRLIEPVYMKVVQDRMQHMSDPMTIRVAKVVGENLIKAADRDPNCNPATSMTKADKASMGQMKQLFGDLIRMKPVASPAVVDPQTANGVTMQALPQIAARSGWSVDEVGMKFINAKSLDGSSRCRLMGAIMLGLSDLPADRSASTIRSLAKL